MPELMWAEMRRYRGWALGLALLNFGGLAYLNQLTDMAQPNIGLLVMIGTVYVVAGQLLGGWQMWGYSRPNVWLNLLHRPLAPRRVMLSLAGAAALLLAAVVMLPVALVLPVISLSGRLIESWQLGLALQAWLLAMTGYLSAALAVLASGRWAILMLVSPFLLIAEFLAVPWLPLPMLGLVLWLLAGLDRLFKPDLAGAPAGRFTPVLLGLPLVLVVTVLMQMGAALATQAGLVATSGHPQFVEQPPAGSYEALRRLRPRELLADSLSRAEGRLVDPASLKSLPVATLHPMFSQMPLRFQPGRRKSLTWAWAERGWRMEFSHAQQIYLAFDNNGKQVGRLGRHGLLAPNGLVPEAQRFEQPPMPLGPWLALGADLLRIEPGGDRLLSVLRLPAAEDRFISDPEVLGSEQEVLLLSNRELLLLDKRGALRWRLALSHGVRDLRNIEVLKENEAWLVSMLEGRPLEPSRPWQTLVRVDAGGQAHTLLSRAAAPSFGDAYAWIYWTVSPLQHGWLAALEEAVSLRQGGVAPGGESLVPPREVQLGGYGLLALSALAAAWLARRHRLRLEAGLAWVLACGFLGLPALLVAIFLMRASPAARAAGSRQGSQAAPRVAAQPGASG